MGLEDHGLAAAFQQTEIDFIGKIDFQPGMAGGPQGEKGDFLAVGGLGKESGALLDGDLQIAPGLQGLAAAFQHRLHLRKILPLPQALIQEGHPALGRNEGKAGITPHQGLGRHATKKQRPVVECVMHQTKGFPRPQPRLLPVLLPIPGQQGILGLQGNLRCARGLLRQLHPMEIKNEAVLALFGLGVGAQHG